MEILYANVDYSFLDQKAKDEIMILRKEFSVFDIQNLQTDRPLLIAERALQLFTFSGTRVNRTIQLLFIIAGIKYLLNDSSSSFELEITKNEFLSKWDLLVQTLENVEFHIANQLQSYPALLDFSKWGVYLPEEYQVKLLKEKYYDIEQTKVLLKAIRIVENTY